MFFQYTYALFQKQLETSFTYKSYSSPFYFDDQFKFILTTHSISSNTFQSNAVQEIHGLHC